jgi:hypothetical protein
MYLQKVISRNNCVNNQFFAGILKVNDENRTIRIQDPDPDPDPNPLVRSMDPRIRIHPKMTWIRNTGYRQCPGSTLVSMRIRIQHFTSLQIRILVWLCRHKKNFFTWKLKLSRSQKQSSGSRSVSFGSPVSGYMIVCKDPVPNPSYWALPVWDRSQSIQGRSMTEERLSCTILKQNVNLTLM